MKKLLIGTAAALSFGAGAQAQICGGDTVTWIIPFGESGGSAKWALFWAPLLSEQLGNEVVVEFMPGAGSTLAQTSLRTRLNGLIAQPLIFRFTHSSHSVG